MTEPFKIGDFKLGRPLRPYIIAEIGVNHEGNLDTARRLIDDASAAGAHAAKFQTYKADKIAIKNSPAYWDTSEEPTETQHQLFQKYDSFGPEDYEALADHCRQVGIDFMSTPFDLDAVDLLGPLLPAFKIASADITNIPLIRKCSSFRKPVIISTGASSLDEIACAATEAVNSGAQFVALLHCVLNYPTPDQLAQLGFIETLKKHFPDYIIGYSDHVVPDDTLSPMELACMLGCQILEKHFTHDKSLPGNDHYHAMDKEDLTNFCQRMKQFATLYGDGEKALEHEESAILHARRSIVAARRIRAGEQFSEDNLIAKRPGHGISPVHWDTLLKTVAARDIEEDDVIAWDQVAGSNGGSSES